MCDEMGATLAANSDLSPDAPEMRAIMQAGETEATAWAFAAGRAIGLPDHVIIEDQDYDGEGEGIRFGLALNAYVGINGMVRGGMRSEEHTSELQSLMRISYAVFCL